MRKLIIPFILSAQIFLAEARAGYSDSTAFELSSHVQLYQASLTSDFVFRDRIHQTEISPDKWKNCCGSWGPRPLLYPLATAPKQYSKIQWSKDRVVEVAKKYIGLPYLHRHIPAMGGLDCSNFSSWVYNYGLGIGIDSNIQRQALTAGRKLSFDEILEPGDLVFIFNENRSQIVHVVIYINRYEVIDSTDSGVRVRYFEGWYKNRFAWARRLIE